MPVVITDCTNKVWAVEQPTDEFIHVGYTGQSGPRLLDVLDFVATRQKQFDKFVQARLQKEEENAKKKRVARNTVRPAQLQPQD